MMNNRIIGLMVLLVSPFCFGQSLNQYEYVIVPAEYDFLKYENQYELNELTKFLFEREGFKTVYDTKARIVEFTKNQCLGLMADIDNKSSMFTTKLVVTLRDCKDIVVWKSEEGRSKLKDYKKGYHEALRNALGPLTELDYTYTEKEKDDVKFATDTAEKETEEEVKEVKFIKDKEEVVEEAVAVEEVDQVVKPIIEEKNEVTSVIEKEDIPEVNKEIKPEVAVIDGVVLLYAQATADGFQLVNKVPKVVFTMVKSSKEDLFILKGRSGIIYKDLGRWFAEYYQDNKLIREAIQIKF